MSPSSTAREIVRELGDVRHDLVASAPLLSCLRYNADLRKASVQRLDPSLTESKVVESLNEMEAPEHMAVLHRLRTQVAECDVTGGDFAPAFDLHVD